MKKRGIKTFLYVLLIFCVGTGYAFSEEFEKMPVKGMVTMIDLGAKKCIPCKMMAPILEKMEKNYRCTPQDLSIKDLSAKLGYTSQEINSVPDGANMGVGCGNPQAIAMLKEGETVLDVGSGGGFDWFRCRCNARIA